MFYFDCNKETIKHLTTIAKIICAGGNPINIDTGKFMNFGRVAEHVLKPIILLYFPDFRIENDKGDTALILVAQYGDSHDFIEFLLKQ